ncbi:histone-arginine methyltransferase CARMER-like isoform X1 [Bolinopsis microptera]|uniref:histone-arginine methyltransferase CARMER-like isoform X1 n=1 Tax=Bolinopsis microptera TaxID=2820187 RepID=UPI003079034D
MLSGEVTLENGTHTVYSVTVSELNDNNGVTPLDIQGLSITSVKDKVILTFFDKGTEVEQFTVTHNTEHCSCGKLSWIIRFQEKTFMVRFANEKSVQECKDVLAELQKIEKRSKFKDRTEESSATQYFQFYGYLSQQQNMLQDYVRTSTFQRAILDNHGDFQGKIVLDVGAGSGILSFFAVQAGAKHVYAVEGSNMADHCRDLIKNNKYQDKITVIHGMIEEVELPEEVDTIVSEPMGYMLYNERMLETYIYARKWLKKGGKMFPSTGTLYLAPFSDESLFQEVCNKANFWYQTFFYGVDLSNLREEAYTEYFKQPIVDTFDPRHLVAKPIKHTTNFMTDTEDSLRDIHIDFTFYPHSAAQVHGIAFWFDVAFEGSQKTVHLSTSPSEPLTHWYQVRCLIGTPLFARPGQPIIGSVTLTSNKRQSYDVKLKMHLAGSSETITNLLDLKNPYFRYTGSVPVPPGNQTTSPSDNYWENITTSATPLTQPQVYNGAAGAGAYNQTYTKGYPTSPNPYTPIYEEGYN